MATVSLVTAEPKVGRLRGSRALVLVLCAAALPAAAGADLRVRERITGSGGVALGERVWSSAPGRVRMDAGAAGFLADSSAGRGWIWDGTAGGCRALPMPAAPAGGPGEEARTTRLTALLAEIGGDGSLIPRQEQRTIAGYDAARYDVVDGTETIQERWMSLDVENTDYDELVRGWVESGGATPWMALEETRVVIQSLGMGYPLRVVDHRTGNVAEAVEVATAALPASTFTPPADCPGR